MTNTSKKVIKWGVIVGFSMITLLTLVVMLNNWFNKNKFIFQSPIQISFYKPIQIVERELLRPQIIEIVNELPQIKDLTPIEEYICYKWGAYECKIALSVARAESGMRSDAIGINGNSVDIGIFQINSVHYKKEICSLDKIVTPEGNVDCAYSIYQDSGWHAWTVWKSGAFKEEL